MRKSMSILLSAFAASTFAAEAPYAFRERLVNPHEAGRREAALKPVANEFAFADGAVIAIGDKPDRRVRRAAEDFADYLKVSMNLKGVRVGGEEKPAAVAVTLDPALGARTSRIAVADDGVKVAAGDARAAMQALFHLEDLMNLRRAPFLKKTVETRREKFDARMAHAGYGMDEFPDGHLAVIAHGGFDSIIFYVKGPDKLRDRETDIAALIDAAEDWGLDAWLYSELEAKLHPDDPGSAELYDRTYGEMGRRYPKARGIIFVTESCWFNSKDPRVSVKNERGKFTPFSFPCNDYPLLVDALEKAYRKGNPDGEFVFWTYNFCWHGEKERLEFLRNVPASTTICVTFATNGENRYHSTSSGYTFTFEDYSICEPGPSPLFLGEAAVIKARNLKFMTQCNTAGRTWDFGCAPYTPTPSLWKRRFDALNACQKEFGLTRLMETHHYGYSPNFIAELAKEAFTEGGMPYDEHLRAIAARDFGERHADEVVAIWNELGEAFSDYVATGENQYGPFRIGPAYPFNALGKPIRFGEMPHYEGWICNVNYGWDGESEKRPFTRAKMDARRISFEAPMFRASGERFVAAAQRLRQFADELAGARRTTARRYAGVVEYVGRSFLTCANVKAAYLAEEDRDVAEVLRLAREEYANTAAALPLVEEDSHLGWEPYMLYRGGADVIRWKLDRMARQYGLDK